MKTKMQSLSMAVLFGCMCATHASAQVYLSEDWQNQTSVPFGPPQIGSEIDTSDSTGPNTIALSQFPNPALPSAVGGKAVKVSRPAGENPVLIMRSTANALVSGNKLEVSWNAYQEGGAHNAPQQVGIGLSTGLSGRLIFFGINDFNAAGGGVDNYFFQTQGNQTSLNIKPTGYLPGETVGWDGFRLVMNVIRDPDFTDFMTGTFDLFITRDVLNVNTPETLPVEQQVITSGLLGYGLIPTEERPDNVFDDITSLLFRVAKGPEIGAGPSYYDNILVKKVVAAPSQWAVNASGDWNTGSNWNGGIPAGVDAQALLGPVITAARTASTEVPITLGGLAFNNANSYTIAGAGSLRMESSSDATVNVQQGTHTINVPTVFGSNTTLTLAAGSSLVVTKPMSIETGKTVTKSGGALTMSGPVTLDANAKLVLNSGATTLAVVPTLLPGAAIDVKNNTLTVTYTGATVAPAIRGQLTSGYAGGAWNGDGINSSLAGPGTGKGLGYRDAAGVITIRYVYNGDTNVDGTVNFADLVNLAQAYNLSGKVWENGDFNYDGTVAFTDLVSLAQNYNLSVPASVVADSFGSDFATDWALAMSLVPEPTSALVIAGLCGFGLRRCRS